MCGHVGIAGNLELKDETTMKRLLVLDYWRGPDSTGLAAVKKHTDGVAIAKMASHPFDLFDTKRFSSALNAYTSQAFIGHNRLSTKGVVNNVNAHPYQFGHITGAHNGTLTVTSHKALEKNLGEEFTVDSQAIFAHIAAFGIEETMKHLQGAWALVWWDENENTLNFLRNSERPLWHAWGKDYEKIFWASEWEFISHACRFSNNELQRDPDTVDEKGNQKFGLTYFNIPENIHFKINPKELKRTDIRPRPSGIVRKGKEVPASNATDPFSRGGTGSTGSSGSASSNVTYYPRKEKPKKTNVALIESTDDQPFGGFMTANRFAEIAQSGCSFCGADVGYNDPGLTIFDQHDIVLCSDCTQQSPTSNRLFIPNLGSVF